MRDQVLDRMDLERERGITIKMQPVRMIYHPEGPERSEGQNYILNLIDTPGHIDFSYEVSRALSAVEGVLLLVDATQGVQAQTLTTLAMAEKQGCVYVPVVSKIDSPAARVDEVKAELAKLTQIPKEKILAVSGKTGAGVDELLEEIVKRIPPPRLAAADEPRGTVFDFSYSTHRGVVLYLRVFDGTFKKGQQLVFRAADKNFVALEVGIFAPDETPAELLSAGEIGYIVTGIKEPGVVAWAIRSAFSAEHFRHCRATASRGQSCGHRCIQKIKTMSHFSYNRSGGSGFLIRRFLLKKNHRAFWEEDFVADFSGFLHLEIITERLKREFGLSLIVTIPTISYIVVKKNGVRETIYTPSKFPEYGDILAIEEPWAKVIIITPADSMSPLLQLLYEHEAQTQGTKIFEDGRIELTAHMPLRELMRGFFDALKSISSGYASLSYELLPERPADVVRMDILVADEPVPAFARMIARRRVEEEGEKMVEKLQSLLPKQLFVTKIQARAYGRIIASRTLSAMRKDVTGYLYGGDITRKMKLLEKQKRGKKKLLARGIVNIPEEVFMKMVQDSDR